MTLLAFATLALCPQAQAAEQHIWTIAYCDCADTTTFEISASDGKDTNYAEISYGQATKLRSHFGAADGDLLKGKVLTGRTLEKAIEAAIE